MKENKRGKGVERRERRYDVATTHDSLDRRLGSLQPLPENDRVGEDRIEGKLKKGKGIEVECKRNG